MKSYTYDQILQLVHAFETHQLPKSAWTHEAHLIVAIHHASTYTESQSLELIRRQISSYNESVGTANTDHSGYHETITRVWLAIAHQYVDQHPEWSLEKRVNQFLRSPFAEQSIIFQFYSKDYLLSTKARLDYISPDLRPVSIQ